MLSCLVRGASSIVSNGGGILKRMMERVGGGQELVGAFNPNFSYTFSGVPPVLRLGARPQSPRPHPRVHHALHRHKGAPHPQAGAQEESSGRGRPVGEGRRAQDARQEAQEAQLGQQARMDTTTTTTM